MLKEVLSPLKLNWNNACFWHKVKENLHVWYLICLMLDTILVSLVIIDLDLAVLVIRGSW